MIKVGLKIWKLCGQEKDGERREMDMGMDVGMMSICGFQIEVEMKMGMIMLMVMSS